MQPSPPVSRLRQLRRNSSGFDLLRLVFVGAAFLIIGVVVLVETGEPAPLLCLFVGASVPALLRRRLVDHPERSGRALRVFGFALVGVCVGFGLVKERVLQALPEGLLLAGLALAVGVYLSAYVVVLSDPSIVRVRK